MPDQELELALEVVDDRVVHLVAAQAKALRDDDPASEMIATSLVPPPMSTIIFPAGSPTGSRPRSRPPSLLDQVGPARTGGERRFLYGALLDTGHTARHANDNARMSEAILVHLLDKVAQHRLGDVEIGNHAVFERRMAEIVPGVRPSMRLASTPTACTSPVRWSIATTDGSERTMPRPARIRAY